MAETGSPEWWRDKLDTELRTRRPVIAGLQAYYDGNHPLPTAPNEAEDSYRRLARMGQTNLCGLIVDSIVERLAVQGVRFPDQTDDDLEVWESLWQPNGLDADSVMVETKALTVGRAAVLVWPGDGGVSITPEDPTEVVVAYKPGSRRQRVAALKEFDDSDAGYTFATLLLPGLVYFWRRKLGHKTGVSISDATGQAWEPWGGETGSAPVIPNPFGDEIPVVEFRSRPTLAGGVTPELTPGVLKIQDRINKTGFDQLVVAEYQAFPQRYAIGIEVPKDPVTGRPINPLKTGPDRMWPIVASEAGVTPSVGQLPAADLTGHQKAIAADIQRLAAITKIPVYYLVGELVNVSADAIRAAEAGLVKKVQNHQLVFGEAWEDVLRLGLRAVDDQRADEHSIELSWVDPESRSMAERSDAAVKKKSVGVPWEQLMEDLGYSPQQIARMRTQQAGELLQAMQQLVIAQQSAAPAVPVA